MQTGDCIRIEDHKLEALGDAYRKHCGFNDVLITGTDRVILFEEFVRMIVALERRYKPAPVKKPPHVAFLPI